MATAAQTWTEEYLEVAEGKVHLLKGGTGDPVIVFHHDIGNVGWNAFYETLAQRHTVYVPSHPGYGQSERPRWMRSVRDMAVLYQWLLKDLRLPRVSLVGLGFGGWIAAEMATMAPWHYHRLVLVGAMGLQPKEGEIFDQALVNYIEYIRAGFHDPKMYEQVFGEVSVDQLETWDINREMTFRIAWKPYMFSQTLPHLLGGVDTPTLVVWGEDDRIVPIQAGRQYVERLPNARLETIPNSGHWVDLEKPDELAKLITPFVTGK